MIRASLALLLASGLGQATPEPYVWPLDLPRELTSSFGEYRPGRYHVGIDLRTGPIGKNVYAADDGHVARIGCSPYGYGKVVYVALKDGNVAVYAHLDEFAPPLDDYVRRAQHAARKYTVNLLPEPGELPIARGQLIAKSGQTGIGVPHLHYEIRDGNHVPIHPGVLGVRWPDTTAPRFRKVALVPLEPDSTVNGDLLPWVADALAGPEGTYTVQGEVRVHGPFAVAVDVFDPAPGGSRLGAYRVTAGVDRRPIFQIAHDRLSYDHLNDGAAAYDPALRAHGQFLALWRKPGNSSEIYPQGVEDGRMSIDAPAEISVEAEDYHGNRATLILRARPESAARADLAPTTRSEAGAGRGFATFEYTGALFVATAHFDAEEPDAPVLRVHSDDPHLVRMRRIGPRQFRAAYLPDKSFADARVSTDHPRMDTSAEHVVFLRRVEPPVPWLADFGAIRVQSRDVQPYGMLALRARTVEPVPPHEELTPASPAVELWPPDAYFDGPVDITMPAAPGVSQRRLHVYRRTRDGWEALAREDADGGIGARSAQLGVFAVMEDAVAPKIELIRPTTSPLNSRRPDITAKITDGGSGIDTFNATFAGQWLLMEYDPEQELLRWERDEDLPAGTGTLVIEITDLAGNIARRESILEVPGG